MQVAARLIEILRAAGVGYLFGNPGTTELPFLDALDGSGLTYVVALQEATAAAAADGYAQASGRLGVVNLHVAPGLANALSIVHNASRAKTPLLVTAGQQDTRLLLDAPILAGDMVKMTDGLTKWSYELRNAAEAPSALRRAIHLALTPPTGPVFLALPMDLMSEPCDDTGGVPGPVPARPTPEPESIARAASLLARAKTPVIVAGDGVARAGAQAELVTLAETLGAAVHGEPIHRRLSFPGDHGLWRGGLYPTATAAAKALERFDTVLVVGASVFTWLFHAPGSPFGGAQTVVQIDDDPSEIGRSYPVTLGIVGGVRAALSDLHEAVAKRQDDAGRAAARERAVTLGRGRDEHVRPARRQAWRVPGHGPGGPRDRLSRAGALDGRARRARRQARGAARGAGARARSPRARARRRRHRPRLRADAMSAGVRTGGEWVVHMLAREGVRHVFGIPGVHNLAIYDALLRQSEITHILARHEQGAAFMADGYARAAGAPGVAIVTSGPAAT